MSSMDRPATKSETVFSRQFESCVISQTSFWQNQSQNVLRKGEDKCDKTNGQTFKTLLKRLQEKRRKTDAKTEKRGEISDSVRLETLHVQRVYDQIAPHIQDLKQKTWPRVNEFLKSLKPGSFVADVGCGNGRYLHINPSIVKVGSDICHSFLHTAAARGFEVLSADNLLLPYRDNIFDATISIGVIHHFASKERRVQALGELVRILCPGGLMMVYVWAFEQKYRKFDSQDILVPWHEPRKSDHGRRKPRVSSLSDVERLSTSSTGSSLSDEDFASCPCHQLNIHSEACKYHQLVSKEHPQICHHGTDHQRQLTDGWSHPDVSKEICHEKCSNLCTENMVHHHDNQLAKGQALIRECQKVESYLSSLCKHTWGSIPGKSKSLNNMPGSGNPPGFSEAANSSEKSSPSCQSLSLQDDEVFLDKTDSPILNSPREHSQKKLCSSTSTECIFDGSVVHDCPLLKLDPEETRDDSFIGTVHHPSPLWKGSMDSLERSASSREMDRTTCISHSDRKRLMNMKPEIQNQKGIEDKLSSIEDDFCFVDVEAEGIFSAKATLSSHTRSHNEIMPRSVLTSLKQGFKNIFTKKTKNGKHPPPCFVPCLAPSQPPEHFQIREFPQSSLPLGTCIDNDTHCSSSELVSTRKPGSDSALSSKADETTSETSHDCQQSSQINLACHNHPGVEPEICKTLHYSNVCDIQVEGQSKINAALPAHKPSFVGSSRAGQPKSRILVEHSSSMVDAVWNHCDKDKNEHAGIGPGATEQNTDRYVHLSCENTLCASNGSNDPLATAPPKADTTNTDLCRFYHVFREAELEDLVAQHFPGVTVVDSFYDHANWCLVLQKL